MGTTMSFYLIENRGLTPEKLKKGWSGFHKKAQATQQKQSMKDKAFMADLKSFMNEEQKKEFEERFGPDGTRSPFGEMLGYDRSSQRKGPALAYRPDAKWLPLFEENLCEGYNASSRDTGKLAETFGAPVLAFSIFDSDILFVSYAAPEKGISEDYAKPNFEGFEEYDMDQYQEAFPQFLCAYGEESELREAWEGEEVFADDRMTKLCELIGAQVLYDGSELPQGFQWIK